MEVIAKNFPRRTQTDEMYPVLIWKERPEIIRIAIYDHTKERDLTTIEEVHYLPHQIIYESNDFVYERGLDWKIGKIYAGVALFTKDMRNLKTLETKNHKCHIFH